MFTFWGALFFGGQVDFVFNKFLGGKLDFGGAKFTGSVVYFIDPTFSGGTVDFSRVLDWTNPPSFDFSVDSPPPGVKLPAAADGESR